MSIGNNPLYLPKQIKNSMSKEKEIKQAFAWVIKRGYMPLLENPERRAEGFTCDFKNGIPGVTQLYSVIGEDVLQSGKFYSVDEVYDLMILEPNWN